MRFNYKWKLSDGFPAPGIAYHGKKVFGTFTCGGGSTMGYKLAGFNHLGGVELDPRLAAMYVRNHQPRYMYNEDIRAFLERKDLPQELFELDILDGSPPCSTFSISGNREEDWGKEKAFNEGQSLQRLDDLFTWYIRLVARFRPLVAIGENVTGLIQGNAKAFVREITEEFKRIGYDVRLFKLNSATMGVPQARERVFFICTRDDMKFPPLRLSFNEPLIKFRDIEAAVNNPYGLPLSDNFRQWWEETPPGRSFSYAHPNGSYFNTSKVAKYRVCPTITATEGGKITHYAKPHELSHECLNLIGTFPVDYNFQDIDPKYPIGMSVPPVMMAQIAHQIATQWLCAVDA